MWEQEVSTWGAIISLLPMVEGQATDMFLEQIHEMVIGQVKATTIPTTVIIPDRATPIPTIGIVRDKAIPIPTMVIVRVKVLHSGHNRDRAILKDLSRGQLPDRDVESSAINHSLFVN